MNIDKFVETILSEYGLLTAIGWVIAIVLWRRMIVIQERFVVSLDNNTEVLNRIYGKLNVE